MKQLHYFLMKRLLKAVQHLREMSADKWLEVGDNHAVEKVA